jgi:hypothetical protein
LAQASAPSTALASPKPDQYSQKLVVIDPVTGEPMVAKYTLMKSDQVIQKGKTDADGLTSRHLDKDSGELEVLIGASDPWSVEYHSGLDQLPLAYTDEDYLQLRGESNE